MDYEVARARPEDKERLLDFAARSYPEGAAQRDPKRWDYVYGSGRYQLWFAHDSTGGVLGQIATIRADCVVGGATDVEMVWLCNIMVDPDARGHGIATALVRAIEDEHRYCGIIGANDASVGLSLSLGWTQLPEIPRYVRIVRPAHYLSRAFRMPSIRQSPRDVAIAAHYRRPRRHPRSASSGAPIEIRRIDQFGDELLELHERIRPHFGFIGDRSADALNDRFLRHPVIQTTSLEAFTDGEIAGYIVIAAVSRDGERVGFILDWLLDPSTPAAGRQILEHSHSLFEANKIHRVEACFGPLQLRRLLDESGFGRWSGGIQGTINSSVSRLMGDTIGSPILSRADSNLHEEGLLSGFAEAAEYHFIELDRARQVDERDAVD